MTLRPRTQKRIERIRQEIGILDLLEDLGYQVRAGDDREQQFPCNLHGDGNDGTPSARAYPDSNGWYCVSVGERVLTTKGWIPLGLTSTETATLDGDGLYQKPVAYMDKGSKACVTVRSKSGYRVTLTSDHEVAVKRPEGWCEAGKLNPGDELVVPLPQETVFNQDYALPVDSTSFNQRRYQGQPHLNLPDRWSLALGEALGYVFGDGWVTPRPAGCSGVVGITSSAEDAEDARGIFKTLQLWSGGRGSEVHRYRSRVRTPNGQVYSENQYVFTIGSDGFCAWFQAMGLAKEGPPQTRRLPESIWLAPQEGVTGFLRGIYATDGSVFRPKDRKRVRINLYSVSEGFLQDVQMLLLQFGILSRLHRPAATRPGGVWYLQLATNKDILVFRSKIGFANVRKQALLDSFEYHPGRARPHRVLVESVTSAGILPVADITMPGDPSFVAGGIKVHNCFGCGASRDAIQTVREINGWRLGEALQWLEAKYHLPALPFDPSDWEERGTAVDLVNEALHHNRTFEEDARALEVTLNSLTQDRDLPLPRLLAFWEAFDKVMHYVKGRKPLFDERKGRVALEQVRQRLLDEFSDT